MLKSCIRNMEREDIEICQFTSKMIYNVICVAGSRSIVCAPAPCHNLDVCLTNFTQTYRLSKIFVKILK